MKKNNILLLSFCALLGLVSCSQKSEFKTADFVTFSSAKYTVKEDAGEIKIPIDIISDKTIHTQVFYSIIETEGEKYASQGKDFTVEGMGMLNITNAKGEVSDSIVIVPVSKVGELQGNKSFEIVIGDRVDENLRLGATASCVVTIIDVDGGINLIVGNWSGSGLKSNNNPASIDWDFALVDEEDEGLKDYPQSNIKILAGSKMTDPIGNAWDLQADLYAYFDDETSELHIYPHQCFDGGNFGDPVGVAYCAIDVKSTLSGSETDIVFMVEDGSMTLSDDMYFALYADQIGSKFTGYTCGNITAGAKLTKN